MPNRNLKVVSITCIHRLVLKDAINVLQPEFQLCVEREVVQSALDGFLQLTLGYSKDRPY
jgi:hypothetical protein